MKELLFDSTPSANIRTRSGKTQEAVWPTYVEFLEDLSQHPGEPVLVYRITENSHCHERGSHAEKELSMGIIRDDVAPVAPDAEKLFERVVFADQCIRADCKDIFFNEYDHVTGESGGTLGIDVRCMSDSWNLREEIYEDFDHSNAKLIEESCYQIVVGLENIANWANVRGDSLRRAFFEMSIKLGLDPSLTPELKQLMLEKRVGLVRQLMSRAAANVSQITNTLSGPDKIQESKEPARDFDEIKAELNKVGVTEAELGRIVLQANGIDVIQIT